MADLLLETKLLLPRSRPDLVARPRLVDLVDRASRAALLLVSAPAGFGKTTLLTSVMTARSAREREQPQVAWVSLDAGDTDAARFWSYALRALERASPGCAAEALSVLEAGGTSIAAVLTTVINELSVRPGDLTLILDDYHLADSPDVSTSVEFLLEHRPPQLHLVISTRADPALPLARWRARGELVEVRASDLRFTAGEASDYLNTVQGLGLTAAAVAALETRTEGWIAALQLAALSLRGRGGNTASFIAGFAGDDRFVVDFLVDEVLDHQPAPLRRFLLDTSIVERLTGDLCDALTGDQDGAAVLERLERRNLLLVPLDDQRRWYRYHHLFADVLRSRLLAERPDDVRALHRRASGWYQQAGDVEGAVRHAFAAGEVDVAADLIELAVPGLRRERREGVIRRWITDVPPAVVRQRPVLAISFVAALMASNEFDGVDQRLDDLAEVLAGPTDGLVVRDANEWARLPALVATQRAGMALVAGDLTGTIEHAASARALAAGDDRLTTAAAAALQGLAAWSQGDLGSALESYTVAADGLEAMGHVGDVLGCTVTLVDLELELGRPGVALRTVTRALSLANAQETDVRGTGDMWVALSRVAWGRGEVAAAAEHLNRAADLGDAAGLPQQPYRWRVAMARLRAAQGDLAAADALLEEAERLYTADFSPNVRPVPATRARLHVLAGDLSAAHAWVRGAGLTAADELSYLREYEHVTLARVLMADHRVTGDRTALSDASSLLERLEARAQAGGRIATVIEIAVLRSLAGDAAGHPDDALRCLERAVALAAPERWTRVFVDEGAPLRRLLGLLEPTSANSAFVRGVDSAARADAGVLAAPVLTATAGQSMRPNRAGTAAGRPSSDPPILVDPLSSRELQVLRLLASDLDGPGIARQLSVSLATVRTHTQHIYAKLGVNSRRQAVSRGHQLGL
jgi:LuxR family maltose regulon positive regulatory protein